MWKLPGYAFLLFALIAVAAQPAQAQVTGSNWTATFYNNTNLSGGPAASEVYPDGIYFNWGEGSPYNADNTMPIAGVNADNFSVRFTSTQTFAEAGTYVFTIYVDDGMRVYFNDVSVIDQFNQNTTPDFRTFTFERVISASEQIAMRVEYVEFTGVARFAFQWGRRTAPPPIYINTPYDGETVSGDYAPTFSWQNVGSPSYLFRLLSDSGRTLLKVVSPAAEICSGDICSIDTGALAERAGIVLENDEYAWRVKTRELVETRKSAIIEFRIEYPGKPLNLSPDFDTVVNVVSPSLQWSDVAAATQYKVVLTRLNNGATIKTGWLSESALNCDGNTCTLDPAAVEPPFAIKRGNYTWRVFARDTALKTSVSKSKLASFKVVPETRSIPLPPPEAPEGFRAP
jgi:hypothetical protein